MITQEKRIPAQANQMDVESYIRDLEACGLKVDRRQEGNEIVLTIKGESSAWDVFRARADKALRS